MNTTRTLVSALSSIVRSVCVAVFTPADNRERPEARDLVVELLDHVPATRASNAPAAPAAAVAEHHQSVLLRVAPTSPVLTAARRGWHPRVALSARGAAKLRRLLPILAAGDTSATSLGIGFTKLDTIRALERSIAKARRRGYTLAQIARALTDNGLPITRATLGVYLQRISKPMPATHAPPIVQPCFGGALRYSSVASTDVDSFESRPASPPFPVPSTSPFPEHSAAANTNHRSRP